MIDVIWLIRFRDAFSKDVEANVIYAVKMLCEPLLALFVTTMTRVKTLAATPNADAQLVPLVRAVGHIMKLFYSLNFVVLPQLIEDNMVAWFNEMQWLLQWTSTSEKLNEHASSETKPGALPRAQALVLDAVTLFAQKHEDEIQPFLQAFVSDAWQLLTRASTDQRDDRRVIAAMTFLQTIAQSVHHELFNNADTLKQICENVVIPNIMLRGKRNKQTYKQFVKLIGIWIQTTDTDCELFEDNPQDYLSRDIEGSDSDTRRRSACELVKVINIIFI